MKEKLIIRNFGPIKDVELDLGRFNILIGEQATGKSTVAKVLAVCRYFSYIVEGDPSIHYDVFKDGLLAWGLSEYIKSDTYISYACTHYSLIYDCFTYIETQGNEWDDSVAEYELSEFSFNLTPISPEFKNLLNELEKIRPKEEDFENKESAEYDFRFIDWIPTSFFQNDVAKVIDNPFYLPTQRGLQSIFSIGKTSINNLSDSLFNQLAKMDGIARHFIKETYLEPLDIYYKNVRGNGYVRKAKETEYYSLFNAASGYQSIIPVVLTIKYYTEIKKKNKIFLIEEPEQNLFPTAQNKVMQYLVEKGVNDDNSVLLATQSPYILTALNNMMFAYQVGQINEEKTSTIIEKKYWIDHNDVSAYMMKPDGTAENIMDEESMQIKGERIDEVSGKFNKDYDDMLDIKYTTVNEG